MEAEPPTGMPMAAMSATTLGAVDLALCGGYLLSVLLVGLFFTMKERRERAAQRLQREHDKKSMSAASHGDAVLEEYYLGGRRIPWWALAVADVSSYIDISGTMINTALVYALGVQGMYIEIRGGLCLFLAFQLAYTGKLSRRCPVKTRGEWCVSLSLSLSLCYLSTCRGGLTLLHARTATGSSSASATGARPCCCARPSPSRP
jgi:hypothetical protein